MKAIKNAPMVVKVLLACFGLFLCCIATSIAGLGGENLATAPATQKASPTSKPTATRSASPTAAVPTPSETAPSQTQTVPPATPSAGLPGLGPADITVNLEEMGFTCFSVEEWEATEDFPNTVFFRDCKLSNILSEVYVEIYGYQLFTVDLISVSVLDFFEPYDDVSIPFLGYIATLPYDGSQPSEARNWVETTIPTIFEIGDIRTQNIGGVEFQLYGARTARILTMGNDIE